MSSASQSPRTRHVLLLTARDWTHPQSGATGTELHAQATQWLAWGHTVIVVSGAYPGCEAVSRPQPRLTIHRTGSGRSVFPRAALAVRRGVGAEAEVVLEVVDGVAFFTPLWWWLRRPVVALVPHVYHAAALGRRARVAAQLLERFPLTALYRGRPVLTVSPPAREDLLALGVPDEHITVVPTGADAAPGATGAQERARASLDVLEAAAAAPHRGPLAQLRSSDTGKAGALAGATLANNAIQLIFTIAVTRVLGRDGYGALAALVSAFLILLVGGQSLQAAAAREVALGQLGERGALAATVHGWTRTLLLTLGGTVALGVLVRGPLSALIGTPEHPWAAAAIPVTGVMWLLVSLQRGVLQGLQAFRPVGLSIVGEAGARLVLGLALAAAAGVSGAFIATVLTFAVVAAYLARAIGQRLGPPSRAAAGAPRRGRGTRSLRGLIGDGWIPIGGLLLLAVLQNVDVIIARHQLGGGRAGSYAVAAVAAKAVVWVAIGVGLQLLPQATARAAAGQDPRPVLWRALGMLAVVATPALLIFALVPKLLLRVAFGPDTVDAAPALLVLGLAMTLLAVAYLTVQFMIALGQVRFLWVLAAVAVGEVTLLFAGRFSITGFAGVVTGAQLLAAGAVVLLAAQAWPRPGDRPGPLPA